MTIGGDESKDKNVQIEGIIIVSKENEIGENKERSRNLAILGIYVEKQVGR